MTNLKQEILKDFNDKFRITSDGELISKTLNPENDIKDFLSQAIDRVQIELLEEIETTIKKDSANLPLVIERSGEYCQGMHAGLDLAIDKILSIKGELK